MKLLFILITIVLFSTYTHAATFTSIIDGNWTSGATWGGSSPDYNTTKGSDVINVSTNVVLNDDFELKGGTVMTITSGDTLTVNGDVTFRNGSFFTVETGGVLIVNGDVLNKNNSDDIVINGEFLIDGNFTGGNGSEITGTGVVTGTGSFDLSGGGTIFGEGAGCSDCSYPPSSLPVEIANFKGEIKNESTHFSWSTLSEVNNDYFIIEKYSEEEKVWSGIAEVKGSGFSGSTINYKTLTAKTEGYFRLKQVDYDGAFDYSKVIIVTPKATQVNYTIYPNPAKDILNIIVDENNSFTSEVIITNSVGQKVLFFELNNKENLNLDISELVKGVYSVTLISNNKLKTFSLIKD